MRMHGIWSVIGLDYIRLAEPSMLLSRVLFPSKQSSQVLYDAHRHRIKEGCITGTLIIEIKIALSSSFPLFAQSIYFSHTFTCVTLP